MARERKRVMGELAAVQMSWLALKLVGEQVSPLLLNPYPDVEPDAAPEKTETRKAIEHRAGWAAIESALFGRKITER